ncbi:hypothetical protein, partial [Chryseobacterium sp.]|uniref:hypothetical protein n=1 Tax=Chryseobacterium sp. TaxID=1871047 RepID=UPI002FCA0A67
MKKVVSIIFIIAMSLVVSIPIFAVSIPSDCYPYVNDSNCTIRNIDMSVKKYVSCDTRYVLTSTGAYEYVNFNLPLVNDCYAFSHEGSELSDVQLDELLNSLGISKTALNPFPSFSFPTTERKRFKYKFSCGQELFFDFPVGLTDDFKSKFTVSYQNSDFSFNLDKDCFYSYYKNVVLPIPRLAVKHADNTYSCIDFARLRFMTNSDGSTYYQFYSNFSSYNLNNVVEHQGSIPGTGGGSVTPPP